MKGHFANIVAKELIDEFQFTKGGGVVWLITFSELADYLMHGREIEFRYKGKNYSITNNRFGWQFCCDTDGTTIRLCEFREFDVLVDKVKIIEIEGLSIENIFNKQLGELEILDIL